MPLTVAQLTELKKNTPTQLTENIFALAEKEDSLDEYQSFTITREQIENEFGRISKQPKTKSHPKSIHFILAHSKEHRILALNIEKQLLHSVESIFPNIKLSADYLLITETAKELSKSLIHYRESYSVYKADVTFIVTPGWNESQMISLANANGILPFPQLFCVSGMPGQLLYDAGISGRAFKSLGGVYSTPCSAKTYVSSVLGFKPETKRVCIAYEKTSECEAFQKHIHTQVMDITTAFAHKGIEVVEHHWTSQDADIHNLRNILFSVDSIIILNEPAAEVHRERLVRLCNAHKKFICASELDSVYAGAALGGGIPGAAFGIPLAGLVARYILSESKNESKVGWETHQIPEQSGMRYNDWAFGMQGVELSEEKTALIKMKSAFDDHCVEL